MPVTVGHILKELDRRNFVNGMAALADIAERNRDLVTQALARAPKSAKVDVAILVATLEKEALARTEEERRRNPPEPWRYAITLMDKPELDEFRRLVESQQVEPNEAARRVMRGSIERRLAGVRAGLIAHGEAVEPDPDELDDDEPAPRPKVRRLASRSEGGPEAADAPKSAQPAPARAGSASARVPGRPRRPFGPRGFDEHGSLTPEPVDRFPPAEVSEHDTA